MRLLGAVLAGGKATRFGSDKALALLDGRPLIAHAAAAIDGYVDTVVVCGRPDTGGFKGIPDWPAPDLGPLGGVCGALCYAVEHDYDAVLTIGCDMPALPAAVLARVVAEPGACFVAQAPVLGRWPVDTFERLERHLASDESRSIRRFARAIGSVAIDAGGELPNVNTTADLSRLH